MPASAPRPVPTMMAVGVARPIAHGQAMTTTPMNAVSASVRRGSGPNDQPDEERAGRDDQDDRDEDLGDAIGQALDGGLAALGATDEVDDAGQRRVAADPRGAHHERAGRVEGRADDLGAGGHLDRHRLAGEHAGVDRGGALDDDAVDRHLLAGPDAKQVADRRPTRARTSSSRPSAHAPGGRGLQSDEPADRPGRARSWPGAPASDRAGRDR